LVVCAVIFAVFVRYETRRPDPFIDVRALGRNANVSLVYVQFTLVNVLFYSLFFGMPQYLQHALGYGADATGIMMLSIAGFGVLVSPFAGRWIDRTRSSKGVLLAGSATAVAGTLLLWEFGGGASPAALFLMLAVLGCSNGFNNLGLQTALYAFVPREETGAASGLFMTSRYLGTILSSSLLGMIFGAEVTAGQFRIMAIVGAALGTALLLLTIRIPRRSDPAQTRA
jgi:MFS family permease